jgi:hypothetical protein
MKLKTIILAGAFALSSTFALAQAGGANSAGAPAMPEKSGNSTMNSSGSAVEQGATVQGTTTGENMKKDGMSNGSMSKDGMKNDSMNKGGMTK